jgi:hypothetical protein
MSAIVNVLCWSAATSYVAWLPSRRMPSWKCWRGWRFPGRGGYVILLAMYLSSWTATYVVVFCSNSAARLSCVRFSVCFGLFVLGRKIYLVSVVSLPRRFHSAQKREKKISGNRLDEKDFIEHKNEEKISGNRLDEKRFHSARYGHCLFMTCGMCFWYGICLKVLICQRNSFVVPIVSVYIRHQRPCVFCVAGSGGKFWKFWQAHNYSVFHIET